MVEVGGRYPGLYTVAGTYNGKGDYYSDDRSYNIFFEAATEDDDDDDGNDDSDDDNRRRRMLDGEDNGEIVLL